MHRHQLENAVRELETEQHYQRIQLGSRSYDIDVVVDLCWLFCSVSYHHVSYSWSELNSIPMEILHRPRIFSADGPNDDLRLLHLRHHHFQAEIESGTSHRE